MKKKKNGMKCDKMILLWKSENDLNILGRKGIKTLLFYKRKKKRLKRNVLDKHEKGFKSKKKQHEKKKKIWREGQGMIFGPGLWEDEIGPES